MDVPNIIKTLFPCFPIGTRERGIQLPTDTEKHQLLSEKTSVQFFSPHGKKLRLCSDEAAWSIVSAMLNAEKAGPSLDATIRPIIDEAGWYESLMAKILAALEAVIKAAEPLNAPMQRAKDWAIEAYKETEGFAADHPIETEVLCTVIALGVLVVLAPYVVEYLGFCFGFGELGPVEGKSHSCCTL